MVMLHLATGDFYTGEKGISIVSLAGRFFVLYIIWSSPLQYVLHYDKPLVIHC